MPISLRFNKLVSETSQHACVLIHGGKVTASLTVDNHAKVVRSCTLKQRPTHLLLGRAIIQLQLQNFLETATGSHGVAERQVTFALSQMPL